MIEDVQTGNRPFLVNLAVRRIGTASPLPGRYCTQRDVWVVDEDDGPTPLVTKGSHYASAPVTKVKQERDTPIALSYLELMTKTHTQLERDDRCPRNTKLFSDKETRPPVTTEHCVSASSLILELYTKTETVRERDDR